MWIQHSKCTVICQAGKPQEEGPSQQNGVWQISSQILSSSTQQKRSCTSLNWLSQWPQILIEKHREEPKICTICDRYNWSRLHSELFRGEFHWLYFKAKQFHIDNTAPISEKATRFGSHTMIPILQIRHSWFLTSSPSPPPTHGPPAALPSLPQLPQP